MDHKESGRNLQPKAAFEESERRYRDLADSLPQTVAEIDIEGNITFANANSFVTFGYTKEDFDKGINIFQMIAPEDHERVKETLKKLVKGRGIAGEEYAGIRKDGSRFPFTAYITPVLHENKPVGLRAIVIDITERKRSEEALRASQLQLSEAMDLAHIVYWEFDPVEDTFIFNDPFYAFYGTTAEQEGGYRMTRDEYAQRFIHPDELPFYYQFVEQNSSRPEPELAIDTEARIVRRDGEVRRIMVRTRIIRDDTGRIIKRFGANQDITERKQMEEILLESEAKYRTVVETSFVGVYIIQDGLFRFVNKRMCEIYGYAYDEIVNKVGPLDVTPLEDKQLVTDNIQKRLSGEAEHIEYKVRAIRKDGTTITVNIIGSTMIYRGRPAILGTILDITEQERVQEQLLKSEEKFRQIFDMSPNAISISRPSDGMCISINRLYSEVTGYSEEEAIGKTWADLDIWCDPNERVKLLEGLQEKGGVKNLEARFRTKEGEVKYGMMSATLIDLDGVPHLLNMVVDITQRKHSEEEKKRLESQLRQAHKMEALGTLAGGIAHDFNNILTALVGYASLLRMKIYDAPLQAYVDQILSASQKATDLVQSLLTFSKQQAISLQPISLHRIIKGTEKLLKRLVTEDIAIKTVLSPEDITIVADATQIDQILFNLVTNARDAMPQGGTLTIETTIVELDHVFQRFHGYGEPGRYALLSISDTGVGMDEATREKIFDPFFSTKEVGKGTGLGLPTVYGIVKQHSGYINVYSEPKIGTTFHIYLPTVDEAGKEDKSTASPVRTGTETILVAEDNDVVRGLICKILGEYGYSTVEATDGANAVEQYKKADTVDLLILDSVMPKMNGRQACNEIRKIEPDLKVIFTSGYTKDVFLDKGVEDGKFNFLQKPISPYVLLQKVREILDGQQDSH